MVGVAILSCALFPIFQTLVRTTGKIRQESNEASAYNYAAKLMKQYAFELTWDKLVPGKVTGEGYLDSDPKTGVQFKWEIDISDAWPVGTAMSVKRTKYHNPCGGPCTAAIEDHPKLEPQKINPKFCSRHGNCVFKTIALTMWWKGPADTGYDEMRKTQVVTRRAVLDETDE